MRLPIDTNAIRFVTAGPPEPVLDFDSGAQRLDKAGTPQFVVHLFGTGERVRDSISVKVAGEPKGLGEFTPVRVTGLVATTWEMEGRHGVSFQAERIESAIKAQS